MKLIKITLVLCFLHSVAYSASLTPHTDLTYVGAFKMPTSVDTENPCYQWQGNQSYIVFNPDGDSGGAADGYPGSLIVAPRLGCPTVGEMNIPIPTIAIKASLTVSSILQSITNIDPGATLQDAVIGNTHIGVGNMVIRPSLTGPRVLAVMHKGYNTSGTSYWEEWVTSFGLDFETDLDSSGWYQVGGGLYVGAAGQYIFDVPSTWASTNSAGKEVIIGGNRFAGGGSHGASLYAIDTWASDAVPPVSGTDFIPTVISEYMNGTTQQMDNYGFANNPGGFRWVEDSLGNASIIASALHMGRPRLAVDTNTNDWTANAHGMYYGVPHGEGAGGKGYNNEPYSHCLMFYDPDDLAASLAGSIQPEDVQPETIYSMAKYFYEEPYHTNAEIKSSGSIAYDKINHIMYVPERLTGVQGIVHVFSVVPGAGTLDTTAPTAPTNLTLGTVTDTTIDLSWTGSTDTETEVTYVIYLNGYPTVRTTNTSYTYGSVGNFITEWRTGDPSPADGYSAINTFLFTVVAVDEYYNKSGSSNSVTHTYSMGGAGGSLGFEGTGTSGEGTGIFIMQ